MNGKIIKVKETLKYLGVNLDFRLSWDKHVEHITNRTGLILQSYAQVAKNNWGLTSNATSIIYDGIYLPIMTYACGTWGWATRKVHTNRKLISSQRRALILIAKAFRTVSNRCLQVIARKPPIDLAILQRQKYQLIKWGENIQTTTSTIHHDDIEWPIPFRESLPPNESTTDIDNTSESSNINIFTDGSRINNSVGCSFVIYNNNSEISQQTFRLDDRCTVFQAELFAIGKAIDYVNQTYENVAVDIYTDSLSAYNLIRSNKLHPLAVKVKNLIKKSKCNIYISWVRAHQGLKGNERADTLAKYATTKDSNNTEYNKISQQTLRQLLWKDTLLQWQTTWDHDMQHITHRFIPDLKKFISIDWYTPDYCTTQIFTKHGKFANYLVRFANRTSGLCPTCNVEDGPEHYIYDCTAFERERNELRILIEEQGIEWPSSPSDIWLNREIYNNFKQFAKQIYYVNKTKIYS
ncbi:uncharacterized protein LOC111634717 [Centruroides sculpturatus]|uniref:uncharacterized protein LOC111634717 n=1 Tax=Centruroides sculpturatus TaxID=218467 RepID=UPI000C6E2382|nr:uncharacterized protein LOC111634717 [Centruroides sculpturatus]